MTKKIHSMQNCPCCGNKSASEFILYPRLPEILFPVDKGIRYEINKFNLKLYHCSFCDHIFQINVDRAINDRIYRQLYKYYPFEHVESFSDTYRKPFDSMFDFMIPSPAFGQKLLEIGCSSMDMMRAFVNKGFICVGVDPSNDTKQLEKLSIIGESYEKTNFDQAFNIVVARFVIEHIIDLDVFMQKLYHDILPSGLVFIQVPSTKNFIKNGILCIGAHEHIHYYSRQSLNALFERNGFIPLILSEMNMPSLVACFCKKDDVLKGKETQSEKSIYVRFKSNIHYASNNLFELIKTYTNICFYGTGLQLMWLLYLSGIDLSQKKVTIVDDNDLLYGRYLPDTEYPVEQLTPEIVNCSDVIILSLNSIYYKQAMDKLLNIGATHKPIIAYNNGNWHIINK